MIYRTYPYLCSFMAKRILIVDDELDLREILQFNLENAGFNVDAAESAEAALDILDDSHGLILLDVMMGGMSGFEMAKIVRQDRSNNIPIIFLTARDAESDLLRGFSVGGDDYVSKPFSLQEVLARVRAVMRRHSEVVEPNSVSTPQVSAIQVVIPDKFYIDHERKMVFVNNEEVYLSRKEFGILCMLINHPGHIFSRSEILEKVWNDESYVLERTVDVHITRVRKKLGDIGANIVNRQGYGYYYQQ